MKSRQDELVEIEWRENEMMNWQGQGAAYVA